VCRALGAGVLNRFLRAFSQAETRPLEGLLARILQNTWVFSVTSLPKQHSYGRK
jgi:hypothetical protein